MSQLDDESAKGVIPVSTPLLLLSMVPILLISLLSWKFQLNLASPILVGTFRTFAQLSILGLILQPIFVWGLKQWWIVGGYIFLMILLASFEAANRSKYYFQGMHLCILLSMIANVGLVSIFAFGVIIRPTPVYNPQYVIPIVGMLLGGCISGVGLSLNSILTALVEQQREVELYLSFGASSFEASSGLVREAVRTGAMPLLNSMALIGLVTIPGMMTGQILGGSPVMEASRYQMLIMYLIGACSLGVILTNLWISLRVGFDASCRLRNERFIKRASKTSFLDRIAACCRLSFGNSASSDERTPLIPMINDADSYVAPKGTLEVRSLRGPTSLEPQLEVIGVKRSFPVGGDTTTRHVLFQNISFQVAAGEIVLVSGPSGVGKSQLLRTVAGLSSMDEGDTRLTGTNQHSDPIEWRKQVRYVTQYKVEVSGTPCDFIQRVASFQSWQKQIGAKEDMLATTRELVQAWGMEAACLHKEWALLSGGEAQRVIVALALASRPKVLLFDESTSALDLESKMRVEVSVESFAETHGISVLWITHDQEQAERMSN